MAIVHVNGFGTMPVAGDFITLIPAGSGGTSTFSRETGRSGGYSVRCTNSTNSSNSGYGGFIRINSTFAEFAIGFSLNHRATHSTANINTVVGNGAYTTYVGIGCGLSNTYDNASGTTGWTILNTSPAGVGWHWYNFVWKEATSGGICEFYRDGTLLARANGDTVTLGAMNSFTMLIGNANGGAQVDVADLIWKNDATPIPDTVVASLFPDSTSAAAWVGSDGNSVDNHLLINENPTYNAATYVGSLTTNAIDTYTISNLPATASSISAVQVGARAFKSEAGARTISTRINGVDGTAADPGGGATVYQVATTNPSGGAAWDTASVNAMTAGIKVVT